MGGNARPYHTTRYEAICQNRWISGKLQREGSVLESKKAGLERGLPCNSTGFASLTTMKKVHLFFVKG
jgi:hypothetical protein